MFIELCLTFLVSFVLILYFDWLLGPHIGQNFEKKKKKKKKKKKTLKIFSSETVEWMNPVICIHIPDSSLYIICDFYSSRIRTLVAMVSIDIVWFFPTSVFGVGIFFLIAPFPDLCLLVPSYNGKSGN